MIIVGQVPNGIGITNHAVGDWVHIGVLGKSGPKPMLMENDTAHTVGQCIRLVCQLLSAQSYRKAVHPTRVCINFQLISKSYAHILRVCVAKIAVAHYGGRRGVGGDKIRHRNALSDRTKCVPNPGAVNDSLTR